MHATLERPALLPPLAPLIAARDRRMDITSLCEPGAVSAAAAAATPSSAATDAYELEVQAQMRQMSHHSWPLYRVEQDRILDRRDWHAPGAAAPFQQLAKPPAFQLDNPLVEAAASRARAEPPLMLPLPLPPSSSSFAPLVPPLRRAPPPPVAPLHQMRAAESPISVLSSVALASLEAAPTPHSSSSAASGSRPPLPPPASSSSATFSSSTAPRSARRSPPLAASTSDAASGALSKKRSRRMSNSERGKLYRSRRKTYVESLESDVSELAQEVQGLEVYGRLLQETALRSPQSHGGSYSRVVAEYFAVFATGMPVRADERADLALVRPTPRQSVFVRTLMAADMAFCGAGGPKRLLHNWQCFSLYHASLRYSLSGLHVVALESAAVVVADAVLRVRLSRATVEKMFPHVLWNEALVQRLVGLDVTYNVGNRFYFSESGKIVRYESHVDFLSAFIAALGSVRDAVELAGPISERQLREQQDAPGAAGGGAAADSVRGDDDDDADGDAGVKSEDTESE